VDTEVLLRLQREAAAAFDRQDFGAAFQALLTLNPKP